MKLVNALFLAIATVIMTAIAGSTFTHILDEGKDAGLLAESIGSLLNNIVHAEETKQVLTEENETLEEANHTFTTSLNIHTPSTVIDTTGPNDLPTPNTTNNSQSPSAEGSQEEYADPLQGLVPLSGEDIAYDKILWISIDEIIFKIVNEHMTIWQIAELQGGIEMLEDAYNALYPARIIAMLHQEIISEDMAAMLIVQAKKDVANHVNISIEEMISNIATSDMN